MALCQTVSGNSGQTHPCLISNQNQMKKLLLFIAFTLLFTTFSCTTDEYEIQPKKKTEINIKNAMASDNEGPGDKPTTPPPPPPPID